MAVQEKDKIWDKEKAVQRLVMQIANIEHTHNKRDALIMIKRTKETAQRIGVKKEVEQRLKILDLIKGEK